MFPDDEPSVDDMNFNDLKKTGGNDGRIKVFGSYPIVSSYVPAILALGFRQSLTEANVHRLLSALNQCCRYYAESTTLPVKVFDMAGDDDAGAGNGNTTPDILTPRHAVPQESFINPVDHDGWVKLIDGLNSYHRRGEACWLFARTIANLPYHAPMMGFRRAGQDMVITIDAKLIRLGALRLAAGSFSATVTVAACIELIALLVEMQGDQGSFHRYGWRIHELFEATSARLWKLAGPPLHKRSGEKGPDLTGLPPFWTEASVTWLQEVIRAREAGYLPGDEFVLSAAKLFEDLPSPSSEEVSTAMSRRHGETVSGNTEAAPDTASKDQAADGGQPPNARRPDEDFAFGGRFRPQPAMRLMEHLDLSPHGDEAKRADSGASRPLIPG